MVSDIRRKIKKAIAEDGTVLFVGAGISITVHTSFIITDCH